MALEEQIVVDLVQYILEQGGEIGSEKLQPFYTKYPGHRAFIKNLRSFCEEHPDRIQISAGRPHYRLKVVTSAAPPLDTLRSKQVAAELALFLAEQGGTMLAAQIHQYYDLHPGHRQIINKVASFCAEHTSLLTYIPGYPHAKTAARLSLPKHCCKFLNNCCEHDSDHQGFLHSKVLDGAVHCQYGRQCKFGHWERIEAQAKASPKGKGKGKSFVAPSPKAASVAANLALYAYQMGGSLKGNQIGGYYKVNPAHKEVISSPGLKSFCSNYDGLFDFKTDADSGRLCLASFCCHFLRDVCKGKKDHSGKRHAKPKSSLVVCNLKAECPHEHWKNIVQTAAGTPLIGGSPQRHICKEQDEVEVPVSSIRWTHGSIRVAFQDRRLVANMLKELLDGDLLPCDIPQIEVLEDKNVLFAKSGNRRLWALKEFQRLRGEEIKVKVNRQAKKLARTSPMFSTTNEGRSVLYFTQNKTDDFPSMSFALAAMNPSTAPSRWDIELGHEIRSLSEFSLEQIQRISELGAWLETPPSSLEDYLQGKPYLFTMRKGAVDCVVTLTGCLEALKLLALDSDRLKISSLGSLEQDETEVRDDPQPFVPSPSRPSRDIFDGFTEASLEEALRSVCAQPHSLFALPELVDLPNDAETCQSLLSFLKQRSNIFSLSSSVFGHTVSLIENVWEDDVGRGIEGDEPDTSVPRDAESSEMRTSEESISLPSLSSHLYSVIDKAGGSLSIAQLEAEVSLTKFACHDLEEYLEGHPDFVLWQSEDGKMVSKVAVQSQVEQLSAAPSCGSSGSRWGKATRQMDATDVTNPKSAEVDSKQELMPRRGRDPTTRQPVEEVGEMVKVTKHSSMGCAVVSFNDVHLRQAILAQGEQQVIDGVQVEIKAHQKKDTLEDVPTDVFVAWGRQAERRSPLSEIEIAKYFDRKCKEVQPTGQCNGDLEGPGSADLPEVGDSVDGSKRSEDEHAGGAFRMLLPSHLNREISAEALEILQSSAHRLKYRLGAPMKAALRSGWVEPTILPRSLLRQQDLDDFAKRLSWKNSPGLLPIPGSPHRAHFKLSESNRLCSITIHVGRYLPGLGSRAKDLLAAGSTLFMGPAGSGKSTILRDVAVHMAKELQVLVVDFSGDLADMESSSDLDYLCCGSGSEARAIREAIDEHVPEVIVAEFSDAYAALRAGRVCAEAGVRLACSVRSNLQFLVDSFIHVYSGPAQARDVGCSAFPFVSVVELSRQTDEWHVYSDAPAVVCSMGRRRLPRCAVHQGGVSEGDDVMVDHLCGGRSAD